MTDYVLPNHEQAQTLSFTINKVDTMTPTKYSFFIQVPMQHTFCNMQFQILPQPNFAFGCNKVLT